MIRSYKADLHVHTCLSPCAQITMSPLRIVRQCKRSNVEMIGICDHNTAENVIAAIRAAEDMPLIVIPGMEITSIEEVHLVALFDTIDHVLHMQNIVYEHLPSVANDPRLFGEQVIANEFDEILGFQEKMLMTATDIPLGDLVEMVHGHGGIAIAAHSDRPSFGLFGQLGIVPTDLKLDAIELSRHITYECARERFPDIERYPILYSSDAHQLEDIGMVATTLWLHNPGFEELRHALKKSGGRRIG